MVKLVSVGREGVKSLPFLFVKKFGIVTYARYLCCMGKIIIGDQLRDRKGRHFNVVGVKIVPEDQPYESTDLMIVNLDNNEVIERSYKQITEWIDKGLLIEVSSRYRK